MANGIDIYGNYILPAATGVKNAAVSLFKSDDAPGDYSSRKASLARQQKLADALAQMGAQEQTVYSAGGITAPVSPMGALARGLTSFGGAYMSGKAAADEAALKKAGNEELAKTVAQFGKPYKTVDEAAPTVMVGDEPVQQYIMKTPDSGEMLAEASRIMASGLPGGEAIGQALLKSEIESRNKVEEYSTTPVYDQKGNAYQISKTGGPPRLIPNIQARDQWTMGMTDSQKAQYALDVAKYGIQYADAQLSQNKAAFEGVGTPGLEGAPPPSALRAPSASSVAPTTATVAQPAPQAQPSGNVPGAMPRTAAPRPVASPPAKPNAASAEVPLTDPRNPVYRGMAPKNVQENITKLNLERATALPQVTGQLATLYNLKNTVRDLSTHPSLGKILGIYDQFEIGDTKSGTINARSLYNQLFSQTAISQLQAMRDSSKTGGAVGQVTEREWDKLSNAALAMSAKQSPEDFKRNLKNYENTLDEIEQKLRGTYKTVYGGKIDFTAPEYTTYAEANAPKAKPSNAAKPSGAGNSNKPANMATPKTVEEYNALPSGSIYFDTTDNQTYRKP
jgi:hypothetical protein